MVNSAPMEELWPVPSEQVCAVMRDVAERILPTVDELVDEVFSASQLSTRYRFVVEDPVLAAGDRRMHRAYLIHWLTATIHHPGRRVPPCADPETLRFARDLVRRGLDTSDLDSWRAGQRVSWRRWTDECFAVTSDHELLRETLQVSGYSIFTFVDDSMVALADHVEAERTDLARSAHAERHATAQLLLEGAPISRARAEARLGYALTGDHVAAIVWVDSTERSEALETAAELVMRACGAGRRLTLVASTNALWLWIPTDQVPPISALQPESAELSGVRVALGRPGRDIEGFRRTHLDAATAQRVLARLGSARQIVRYEDIQLVAALSADMAQAEQFVTDTLGEFATADTVLRETALTYALERFNATSTAERLFTHRNTIERRLARVDRLLPRPLVDNATSVVAALMYLQLRDDR
ncbi:PucR family transcriptional regulator [Nocardia sp. NPDC058176]|uniref:PucR family transcriptional regulator n=1 Tax=Nocardia sp. NPDC058176 TaxID=3346368 RepID=UPI0036DA8955